MPYHFPKWSSQLMQHMTMILPSSCALCGVSSKQTLCSECEHRFFGTPTQRCTQCASPLAFGSAATERCGDCLSKFPAFDATIVASDYAAPIDQLVLALKFGHQLALAPLFARMLHDAILRQSASAMPELLAVVPLGEQRLAERGFNQALEIAKPLAQALALPLATQLLERTRETLRQTMLAPAERHRNIHCAFILSPRVDEQVRSRHIGVVDDVMTTGETLNEIAATLKRHGAARVTNLIFARTSAK